VCERGRMRGNVCVLRGNDARESMWDERACVRNERGCVTRECV